MYITGERTCIGEKCFDTAVVTGCACHIEYAGLYCELGKHGLFANDSHYCGISLFC